MRLFLDFDDTLATGPATWAITHVLPNLIEKYRLPYEQGQLDRALLIAQQQAAEVGDDQIVLDTLFTALNWSSSIKNELLNEVFANYRPALFDDTIAFLDNANKSGHELYVLSNNNHSPLLTSSLGIGHCLAEVFTPEICGTPGKPCPDIWHYIKNRLACDDAVIVGDDPWSDAALAHNVSVPCWIVDRLNRYGGIQPYPYTRVRTLGEIPLG